MNQTRVDTTKLLSIVVFVALAASTSTSGVFAVSSPPLFVPLDALPGYGYSTPFAISADGSTVVGQCGRTPSAGQAFAWTAAQGFIGLGFLPGTSWSLADDVSADGSVIVGYCGNDSVNLAFRYTTATGMQPLGTFPGGTISRANAVSADGTVIAGYGDAPSIVLRAFRWTAQQGMVALGSSPFTRAYGISANGLAIVGDIHGNDFDFGMRWTASTGMVILYPGPGIGNSALAASANGGIVVGAGGNAFRWTAATGGQDLPNMRVARSISADGSIIVGEETPFSTTIARVWTQSCGTRTLRDLLLQAGLSLVSGWTLNYAYDIADDNRTIVGLATNPQGQSQGFLARLPKKGDVNFDGVVNVDDLLKVINSWGACPPSSCAFLDFNCDGTINQLDLTSVMDSWD